MRVLSHAPSTPGRHFPIDAARRAEYSTPHPAGVNMLRDATLDEAASPRDGGSGLGGLCGLEEARRRKILV